MKIALVSPFGSLPERFKRQERYIKDFLEKEGFDVRDFLTSNFSSSSLKKERFLEALESDVDWIFPLCGGTDQSVIKLLPKSLHTQHSKGFCGGSSLGVLCAWLCLNTNISVSSGQHIVFLHPKSSFQENLYSRLSWWNFVTNSVKVKGLSGAERKNVYQSNNVFSNVYCFLRKQSDVVVHHPKGLVIQGKTVPCSLEQVTQIPSEIFRDGILITDTLNISPEKVEELFQNLNNLGLRGIIFTANQRSDEKRKFPEYLDPEFISVFVSALSDCSNLPISYGFPFGHSKFKLPIPWMKEAVYDGKELKLVNR